MPAAGQRTHGTSFRALKATSQVATPGAVSAVYDCLVDSVIVNDAQDRDSVSLAYTAVSVAPLRLTTTARIVLSYEIIIV